MQEPKKKPQRKGQAVKPETAKPKVIMWASKRLSLYHPYQNIRFLPGVPTACKMDSWLESQVNAELISEVK